MSIKKYFWSLNPKALREVKKILRNPKHPRFIERAFALFSRCDNPKEVFSIVDKKQFVKFWPSLRRYWAKINQATDFKAWWETVYEQLLQKQAPQGKPSEIFLKIGKIIKEKRLKKKVSQLDFARQTRMSQPDISSIEAGKKNITLGTLIRLCKILDVKSLPFS